MGFQKWIQPALNPEFTLKGHPPSACGIRPLAAADEMIMIRTSISLVLTLFFSSVLIAFGYVANDSEWKAQTQIKLPAKANSLAYSADGSRIAVGHPDGRVTIWDVKSGTLLHLLNAHSKKVNSIQFILGDSRLLTIGDEERAVLWSTSDWSEVGRIDGVAFSGSASPDGRWLVAQDPKQAIWIWDLSTLNRVKQLTEPGKGGMKNISLTANGRYVVTAYNTPLRIDLETNQSVPLAMAGDKKTSVNIQQEGNRAAISLGSLQDDDAPTHRMIPSLSGSLVALGRGWYGQPDFVDVWDINAMKRIGRYKPKDAGTLTSFSFDNSLLAVEGAKKVTLWRIVNGKQVASVQSDGIMQFSPKAMELAATDGNNLLIYVPKQ
jgi:WD40 repeat protein